MIFCDQSGTVNGVWYRGTDDGNGFCQTLATKFYFIPLKTGSGPTWENMYYAARCAMHVLKNYDSFKVTEEEYIVAKIMLV